MDMFKRLKHLAKMKTEEDIKEFERIVWDLVKNQDPEVLKELIDLFDDNCDHPEVMYNLVHAIETYPDEIYLDVLILKMEEGLKNYPFWYLGLFTAVLNSPESRKILENRINLVSKETFKELFDLVYKESPSHRALINELRNNFKIY